MELLIDFVLLTVLVYCVGCLLERSSKDGRV